MVEANAYLKRLKELREQIEKGAQKKTLAQAHEEVSKILGSILGEKQESKLASMFEKELINKGLLNPRHLETIKSIMKINNKDKKTKSEMNRQQVEDLRKDSSTLIRDLTEFKQREELSRIEKGRFRIKTAKGENYELISTGEAAFLISQTAIKKITNRVYESNEKELSEHLSKKAASKETRIDPKIFHILELELGQFEMIA